MGWTRGITVALLSALVGAPGCGGSGGGGGHGGSAAGEITISGTLSTGIVNLPGFSSALRVPESGVAVSTLAGFQLYCVTLSKPAASATTSADDLGKVSLTIAAKDVPFGCFVLDAQGSGVATVTFNGSSTIGQTVALSGSADLGTITVDSTSGVAQAGIPSGGALVTKTPADAPCPLGIWSYVTTNSAGTGSGTTWIAKTGSGMFALSVNGISAHGSLRSFSNVPGAYANSTLSIGPYYPEANTGSSCASTKTAMISVTANDTCTQMTGTVTRTGCASSECSCEAQAITVTKE